MNEGGFHFVWEDTAIVYANANRNAKTVFGFLLLVASTPTLMCCAKSRFSCCADREKKGGVCFRTLVVVVVFVLRALPLKRGPMPIDDDDDNDVCLAFVFVFVFAFAFASKSKIMLKCTFLTQPPVPPILCMPATM